MGNAVIKEREKIIAQYYDNGNQSEQDGRLEQPFLNSLGIDITHRRKPDGTHWAGLIIWTEGKKDGIVQLGAVPGESKSFEVGSRTFKFEHQK